MEKILNRNKYFGDFIEFRDLVELRPEFMSALEKHHYFADEMKNVVQRLVTEAEKKLFILVHFTRSRSTCEEIIQLLAESGQKVAAEKLTQYNTSMGRIEFFKTTAEINLYQCVSPIKGSLFYDMLNKPRGTAIIINNVNNEVFLESKRFKFIYEKLHFNVQLFNDLTKDQIEDQLKSFAKSEDLENPKSDAFILMVISHGFDEKILGINACKAMNTLTFDKNNTKANKDLESDVIEIMKIVDIFSNNNCRKLINRPKLFFFNCCRIKMSEQTDETLCDPIKNLAKPFTKVPTIGVKSYNQLRTMDDKWSRTNQDTYICYACAEGFKSFYDRTGITNFGQALSHSIAQYACEETLNSIMSRTCDLLQHYSDQSGNFAPEIKGKGMRREIYFNP